MEPGNSLILYCGSIVLGIVMEPSVCNSNNIAGNKLPGDKGLFITFEGGEGCGKTTMVPMLKDHLTSLGFKVECTREPGGTKIAEQIRNILVTKDEEEQLNPKTELLLMYSARAQLVNSKIKSLLEDSNTIVISDRFDLSTVAYQGYGRGIALDEIAALRHVAIGDFKPDLTLLFDLDIKEGLLRANKRSAADRFEQESLDFFYRVQKGFQKELQNHAHMSCVIDSSKSIEEVKEQVIVAVNNLLKAKGFDI